MVLFAGKIRVTVERYDWHATCETTQSYEEHQRFRKVQDNEPVDEKTNRALTSPLREISPQINTDFYGLRVCFLRLSKITLLNSGLSPKFSSNPTSISVARK